VTAAWGLADVGVSFGSATGDFDGDGDLDLVYTNYEKGVTLLRNDAETGARVLVALRGTKSNRFGVGATVTIKTALGIQTRQLAIARGYCSSSEPVLQFGLANATEIERLEITWPSGARQVLEDLAVERRFTITEPASAVASDRPLATNLPPAQFTAVKLTRDGGLYVREAAMDEQAQNPLGPMRQKRRGPALAVGDVNGDGRDDFILGGSMVDPPRLLIASEAGAFGELPV